MSATVSSSGLGGGCIGTIGVSSAAFVVGTLISASVAMSSLVVRSGMAHVFEGCEIQR
jgi:hypothetical protein